jgi:hypothetical protein
MNRRQRLILIMMAVIIAGMMLYPPYIYLADDFIPQRHGYDSLLGRGAGNVDVWLLLAQFVAVGFIGFLAYKITGDEKK